MIDKPYAKQQVERLSQLDGFPHEKAAFDELVLAMRCASSAQAAKTLVDGWIATERMCPKPADLRKLAFAAEHSDEYELKPKTGRCERCGGTGWVGHQRKTRALPGMAERVYDCAAPCSCPAGVHGRKPNEGAA